MSRPTSETLSHAAEQHECAAQNDNAVDPVAFQFNRSKRVRQTVNKAITFGVAFPILGGATSAVEREAGASLQGSVLLNPTCPVGLFPFAVESLKHDDSRRIARKGPWNSGSGARRPYPPNDVALCDRSAVPPRRTHL